MAKIYPTLARMILDGIVPLYPGGAWIDIYNACCRTDIAGTVLTRIDHGNYWYVTELRED